MDVQQKAEEMKKEILEKEQKECKPKPEPEPNFFFRNKFLVGLIALIIIVNGGPFTVATLMELLRFAVGLGIGYLLAKFVGPTLLYWVAVLVYIYGIGSKARGLF